MQQQVVQKDEREKDEREKIDQYTSFGMYYDRGNIAETLNITPQMCHCRTCKAGKC